MHVSIAVTPGHTAFLAAFAASVGTCQFSQPVFKPNMSYMLRGLKVISQVMLLSLGNSQNADGREKNTKPTILHSICCYKDMAEVPGSKEWDGRN